VRFAFRFDVDSGNPRAPSRITGGHACRHSPGDERKTETNMGRFDRRNSMKMKRKKAQVKKKARVKKARKAATPAAPAAPAKKTRSKAAASN
jgi:hypothetical protein